MLCCAVRVYPPRVFPTGLHCLLHSRGEYITVSPPWQTLAREKCSISRKMPIGSTTLISIEHISLTIPILKGKGGIVARVLICPVYGFLGPYPHIFVAPFSGGFVASPSSLYRPRIAGSGRVILIVLIVCESMTIVWQSTSETERWMDEPSSHPCERDVLGGSQRHVNNVINVIM